MGAWFAALVAIVLAAILGTVVAFRRTAGQAPRHTLREILVARVIAVVVITALVALAVIE